ncbi:hypothetical protein HUJ05_000463 [Dendroctonus ponderosae]|nr:hypothetical protein HUJ05_000463 [Dendroctonus ponderosae]
MWFRNRFDTLIFRKCSQVCLLGSRICESEDRVICKASQPVMVGFALYIVSITFLINFLFQDFPSNPHILVEETHQAVYQINSKY